MTPGAAGWPHQTAESLCLWNNTNAPIPNNPGRLVGSQHEVIQANRDYFNDTPKPGYTPYPYPHPLATALPNLAPLISKKPGSPPTPAENGKRFRPRLLRDAQSPCATPFGINGIDTASHAIRCNASGSGCYFHACCPCDGVGNIHRDIQAAYVSRSNRLNDDRNTSYGSWQRVVEPEPPSDKACGASRSGSDARKGSEPAVPTISIADETGNLKVLLDDGLLTAE